MIWTDDDRLSVRLLIVIAVLTIVSHVRGAEPSRFVVESKLPQSFVVESRLPVPAEPARQRLATASGRVIEQRPDGVWVYVDAAPEVTPQQRPFPAGGILPTTVQPAVAPSTLFPGGTVMAHTRIPVPTMGRSGVTNCATG